MDLKKLRQKPFVCIYTSIGRLCAFRVTMKRQDELDVYLKEDCSADSADKYVRALIRLTCYPPDMLLDEEFLPRDPVLSDNDVSIISAVELETIAEIIVLNSEYLFRDTVSVQKNKAGTHLTSRDGGEIVHPKKPDETFVHYLHRLACIDKKKRRETIHEMFKSISGITGISEGFAESIRNSFSAGEALRKSLETLHAPTITARDNFRMPEVDFAGMEEARLRPFRELSFRLDQLIESSTQTSEFLIEANRIHTEIAAQIKSSGESTEAHSKKNINLSYVVIGISAASLILAAYSTYKSTEVSDAQVTAISEISEDLDSNLTRIFVRNSEEIESLSTLIRAANNELQAVNDSSARDTVVDQNQIIIDELRELNSSQAELVKLLQELAAEGAAEDPK